MPLTTPATLSPSRAINLACRLTTAALGSSLVVGALSTGFMYLRVVPLILDAEAFEVEEAPDPNATAPIEPEPEEWAPADGAERGAFTFLSNVIISFAFALLLVGLAILDNAHVSTRSGMQRGAVGWAVFMALPCIGLSPELPGMAAAAIVDRQWWWLYAVLLSAAGFAIVLSGVRLTPPPRALDRGTGADLSALRAKHAMHFLKRAGIILVAIVIAAIPHLTGAPHPHITGAPHTTTCGASHVACERPGPPSEMAAIFAVWCLATALAYWLVLGVVCAAAFNLAMGYEMPLPNEVATVSVKRLEEVAVSAESAMEAL